MRKYVIRYTDESDPGCPTFACVVKAYSKQDAEERFSARSWDGGWRIVSIEVKK